MYAFCGKTPAIKKLTQAGITGGIRPGNNLPIASSARQHH